MRQINKILKRQEAHDDEKAEEICCPASGGCDGFGPFSSDVKFHVDTDHIKEGQFGFTFVAKYDYKDTKLDELIKKITSGNGTDIKSNHVDNWTNVGVVVKTVNGQTYIAVSVAIDVS